MNKEKIIEATIFSSVVLAGLALIVGLVNLVIFIQGLPIDEWVINIICMVGGMVLLWLLSYFIVSLPNR